ncbi:glycerol-3-phosphate 1-O-acyltransferase PlsB [Hydrocarboniclastica marina]|uniref:Glycerol-3-phosphate acyltransferase n=1 Tax=Hydrocarboniclastica marina TaxID=2259620 RepID=A0A4P7XEI0_9ALTE|nr:glycerol-3-phosphate 1-O-acyltransferase PlsB [Hydrocarboniclastica marina]QCF25311.1 glycerol-3-phosphate 1-O-acyltransferase PlsB [Hydrocarboniclastica marina]
MGRFLGLSAWFFTLLRKLLFLYVRTNVIGANREQLGLDPHKPVCYVLQYSSLSSRLVLEQTVLANDLPSAQRPLRTASGVQRSFVFLYQRQGGLFRQRPRPTLTPRFQQLVKAGLVDDTRDVQIVPVSLFWGRSPDKENSLLKILLSDSWAVAGRLQKFLIILLHGRSTFVQFNQPLSLRQVVEEFPDNRERATRKLARILRVHFRRVRQAVIGPDLSHRRTVVNAIIHSQAVRTAINEAVERDKISRAKARKHAQHYGWEIASNFSMVTVRLFEVLLAWLWNRIYNGVQVNNIQTVRDVATDSAIVYVPCHRSHIDYMLLSYVLYSNGLTLPHIAAGINLNMPLVGPILRRGGAFFMRRSFKNNPLYATVFNEYMHVMFARGYSVEYFVEGGRSRTGRTLQPRPGMLSMTVRSFLRDHRKPIVFIPVYVGYEKVLEGRSYLGELKGRKKENENVFGLFKSLKNLRNSFGRVSVNFGDPIHLSRTLDQVKPDWREVEYDEDYRPQWLTQAVDTLASEVVTGINAAAAVNPVNLLATILLATERLAMDESMLAHMMEELCRLLKAHPYSQNMTLPSGTGTEWVAYGESMGLLHRQQQKLGDIITVEGNNAIFLTYYRNNIQHLFALPALIACLFQNNNALDRDRIRFLVGSIYPYIQSELFLRWSVDEVDKVIDQWIDVMVEQDMLSQQGQVIYRPVPGSAQAVRLRVLSRCILQTLERYFIAIAVLRKHGPGKITAEELEEQSTLMAQRMSILFGLNAPEFFDKTLFRNFISNLKGQETVTTNAENKLEYTTGLDDVAEDARLVLSSEMRQSILQVTQLGG